MDLRAPFQAATRGGAPLRCRVMRSDSACKAPARPASAGQRQLAGPRPRRGRRGRRALPRQAPSRARQAARKHPCATPRRPEHSLAQRTHGPIPPWHCRHAAAPAATQSLARQARGCLCPCRRRRRCAAQCICASPPGTLCRGAGGDHLHAVRAQLRIGCRMNPRGRTSAGAGSRRRKSGGWRQAGIEGAGLRRLHAGEGRPAAHPPTPAAAAARPPPPRGGRRRASRSMRPALAPSERSSLEAVQGFENSGGKAKQQHPHACHCLAYVETDENEAKNACSCVRRQLTHEQAVMVAAEGPCKHTDGRMHLTSSCGNRMHAKGRMPQYMHALIFVSHRACVHDVQPSRNLQPRVGQASGCSRLDHTEFWPMYGRAERPMRKGRRNHRSSAAPMKSGSARCHGPSRTAPVHICLCSWVRLQVAELFRSDCRVVNRKPGTFQAYLPDEGEPQINKCGPWGGAGHCTPVL
jgi:hypothetical protein